MSRGRAFGAIAIATVLVLGLALGMSGLSFGSPAQAQEPAAPAATRFVTVVGQGKTNVVPDIATMNLGVMTSAPELDDAMSENTATMAAIQEALLAAGIAENDIQTTNYNIYLDEGYRGPEMQQNPVYRVSNMVLVKVRDLGRSARCWTRQWKRTPTRSGISFTVEDWSGRRVARAGGIADARARAEELASWPGRGR